MVNQSLMHAPRISLSLLFLAFGGCSPLLEMGGAYFPGWLLSAIIGLFTVAVTRAVFLWLRLDAVLEPRILAYPALAVFFTLVTYLILFP